MAVHLFAPIGPILSPERQEPPLRVVAIQAEGDRFLLVAYGAAGEIVAETRYQSEEAAQAQAALEYGEALGQWQEMPPGFESPKNELAYLLERPVVECQRLAEALVSRLQSVIPREFDLVAESPAGHIRISDNQAWDLMDICTLLRNRGDPGHWVEWACHSVLDRVQDFVAEAIGEPWPSSGSVLPLPNARVTIGRIELWYGDESRPALRLPDLTYVDIQ